MSKMKKILFNAAALAAIAGSAHAAKFGTFTVGGESVAGATTATFNLASEVVFSTAAPTGTIVVPVLASSGVLPSGNILLDVSLTNVVFQSQIGGGAVTSVNVVPTAGTETACTVNSAVLSSGGGTATGSVTFVLSGLDDCGVDEGAQVTLPVRFTGGNVSATAAFRTEASIQVDGGSVTRETPIVTIASAFTPVVTADTATTQLTLASGFKSFSIAGTNNSILGTAQVRPNANTVYRAVGTTAVSTAATDVKSVKIDVTGDFTGFSGTGKATMQIAGATATVTGSTASVTVTGTDASALVVGTSGTTGQIAITAGTVVLNAADYTATMTVTYDTSTTYSTATEAATLKLDSVVREGQTVLMPWTSSSNNAQTTGSNNIIRVGNRTSSAINGVFARVVNTSKTGYTNPGLVSLGSPIPANGELLINSDLLEQKLGDFGRGDVEIVIEALESAVSIRRLVARPDGVFAFDSGAN